MDPRSRTAQNSHATSEDIFLTLAADDSPTRAVTNLKASNKEERKSRLGFGSPSRFSPSRLLSRRPTTDNTPKTRAGPILLPIGNGPNANRKPSVTSPNVVPSSAPLHSSGDKRARPLRTQAHTQEAESKRLEVSTDNDSSVELPEAKRRRLPSTEHTSTKQPDLGFNLNRNPQSPSPLVNAQNSAKAVPPLDGIYSSESVADSSSVWDELDDIKSRIQNLEITGGRAKRQTSNGIEQHNGFNLTRTNHAAQLQLSRPLTQSFSPAAADQSSRLSHQLLQSALHKASEHVNSNVYSSLEAAVTDAFDLSAIFSEHRELSEGASNVPYSSDRRHGRKIDNLCRNLTDLCIALYETSERLCNERSSSRLSTRLPDHVLRSRSSRERLPPSSFQQEPSTRPGDSSPLTHFDDRRSRRDTEHLNLQRPSSQFRRAKTAGSPTSSPLGDGRRPSLLGGPPGIYTSDLSSRENNADSRPQVIRSFTGGNILRSSRGIDPTRPVSSATAYRDHLGNDMIRSGSDEDDDPTIRIPSRITGRYIPNGGGYHDIPNSQSEAGEDHRTSSFTINNTTAGSPPLEVNGDSTSLRQFSRAYTARYPMPELSPKYSNRDLRGTATTTGASPEFSSHGPQPPPPPPKYAASDYGAVTSRSSDIRRRGSTAGAATAGGTSSTPRQYSPSAASLLADRIRERRLLLSSRAAAGSVYASSEFGGGDGSQRG